MAIDRKRLSSILVFALEAGVIIALVLFPSFAAGMKTLTNVFMTGRSSVEVYLFVIVLLVARRIYVSKGTVLFDYSTVFLYGMFLLYLLGLWEYLSFSSSFIGNVTEISSSLLKVFQPSVGLSGTALTHSHNAKAVLAYPLFLIGFSGQMKYFNAGAVFVGFNPAWFLILHGMIYVAFFIAAFLTLGWAKKILSPQRYLILTLAVAVNLKYVIDGGILDPQAWNFGIPVYLFCWLEARRNKDYPVRSWILGLAVVSVFYMSYEWIDLRWHFLSFREELNVRSLPLMYAGAAVMALFVNGWDELRQRKISLNKWCLGLLLLAVFCFWRHVLPGNARENYSIQPNAPLLKGEELLLAGWSEKDLARGLQDRWFMPLEKESLEGYALWCVRLEKDMRYYDLSREIGVQPQYGSFARPTGNRCFDGKPYRIHFNSWISPCVPEGSVSLRENFSLTIGAPGQKKTVFGRDYCRQEVQVVLPLNTPMKDDALLALVGRAGIRELIRIGKKHR